MGILEAFLLGVLLTAGVNGLGIKYMRDQHKKEIAALVAKKTKPVKKTWKSTSYETVKKGSFTMNEGGAHIQVNTGDNTKTRVEVKKDGLGKRITINSSNTIG